MRSTSVGLIYLGGQICLPNNNSHRSHLPLGKLYTGLLQAFIQFQTPYSSGAMSSRHGGSVGSVPPAGSMQAAGVEFLVGESRLGISSMGICSDGPIQTKAHQKFWRKGSAGKSRDCPFFVYPLLSQELEKLRISNLARTFRVSIRTKSH